MPLLSVQLGSALRRNLARMGAESGHEALMVIGVQGPAVMVFVHAPRMEWKRNGLNATILSRFMMSSNLFLIVRGVINEGSMFDEESKMVRLATTSLRSCLAMYHSW